MPADGMNAATKMTKGNFDTSLQQLSEEITPVAREQERAGCKLLGARRRLWAVRLHLQAKTAVWKSRLLLAAMGPVVRHLPARLPNDFDLTDGLLPAVCGRPRCVPASSVAMCQSLLIQVVGFCGWRLRSMTRRALPTERSIWPGSATVTSTPKPITFRI
jgi:hypothetical protein